MTHMSPQPVTPATMRRTVAGFATGLSSVAAEVDGRIIGMPAYSLSLLSLNPPLVSLRSREHGRLGRASQRAALGHQRPH